MFCFIATLQTLNETEEHLSTFIKNLFLHKNTALYNKTLTAAQLLLKIPP